MQKYFQEVETFILLRAKALIGEGVQGTESQMVIPSLSS